MNPEFHEFAEIFPMMSEEALSSLAADIKANGLREPVRLFEGRPLRMNSGRTEAIRIQLVNAWQKGLACRIEDALCGATSASSVHEQIEHHHHRAA